MKRTYLKKIKCLSLIIASVFLIGLYCSFVNAVIISIQADLYTDNNGIKGTKITETNSANTVLIQEGDIIYVDIMAREWDPLIGGLRGIAYGIQWDPTILENIDDTTSLQQHPNTPLKSNYQFLDLTNNKIITELLPGFRSGQVSNSEGKIDNLAALVLLAGLPPDSPFRPLGNFEYERTATLKFRAKKAGTTTLGIGQGRSGIVTSPVVGLDNDDIYFEPQVIYVGNQNGVNSSPTNPVVPKSYSSYCSSECNLGDRRCVTDAQGQWQNSCGNNDEDNCFEWAEMAYCASGCDTTTNYCKGYNPAQKVDLGFSIKLYEDTNGVIGAPMTDNTLLPGETFFAEILVEDGRTPSSGIIALPVDILWDDRVIENIDTWNIFPDEISQGGKDCNLMSCQFVLQRYVNRVSNSQGIIKGLRGASLPAAQKGKEIGKGTSERLSLLHFKVKSTSLDTSPLHVDLSGAMSFADGGMLGGSGIAKSPPEVTQEGNSNEK